MAALQDTLAAYRDKNAAKAAADPTNPFTVAKAQSGANIETAEAQQRLGMTPQDTPWGSLSYTADASSPSGYRATTTLSPDQQALLDQYNDLQGETMGVQSQYSGVLGGALDRAGETMGTPFDLNAGRATELTDIQRTLMDPQWDQRGDALHTDLLNRGLRPGSEQWATAMQQHEDARARAYDQMFLDSYGQANQAALMERNLPLTDLQSLFGMPSASAPGSPQWAPVPTPGVAPTDISGSVAQANALAQQKDLAQQQMKTQQENAKMGGLFGMGSAALGGWAMGGFPGASALLAAISDRRLKTAIAHIADDPRGFALYAFRYLWDAASAPLRFGYMAQEVAEVRPDAVLEHPSGYLMVDYGALA
jgi:hypothetical protein